jgi:signal transduction histidine kinase
MNQTARSIPASEIHLQGYWLVLVRTLCLLVTTFSIGLFLVALPLNYQALSHPSDAISRGLVNFGLSLPFYALCSIAALVLLTGICWAIAVVIFWQKSDNGMALFVVLLLVTYAIVRPPVAQSVADTYPVWQFPILLVTAFNWAGFNLFFLLFPTGRFVPSWTRWLVPWTMVYALLWRLPQTSLFSPAQWPLPLLALTEFGGGSLYLFALIYRYWRVSDTVQRQQTKWVVFGIIVATLLTSTSDIAFFFPSFASPGSLYDLFNNALYTLLSLIIPICFGIAILRYRLWDIDIIIKRTLVYGILTASIVGLYILVVVFLGGLFHTGNNLVISLLATSLVAVLFQPLREWLQRAVNRLLYGQRDEPYRVISQLGQRLEATLAPDAVLSVIVETVAQALKLPYAAIALKQDEEFAIAASYVSPKAGRSMGDAMLHSPDTFLHLPLLYQSEPVGELVLAPRARGESLTPADQRLLADLARQVGIAAHAVRLTADLQQSRERLVTAREEERRRLRRDLHDGLGSVLTSMMFKLDASDTLFERDPGAAKTLLAEVRTQMQTSLDDIRRLVYNLRPPILDEWGLVAALREQVVQHQLNQVQVFIEAPESFPKLSAAVEVAAYRIALEALSNVLKHAQATTCSMRLALLDDALTVEVQDNGAGPGPVGYHAGVGITAMRERAVELGGTCVIEAGSVGGTRVCARFPMRKE